MAASFNKVILLGNLTRDPETRTTSGGLTICKIGLAVNRVFTTQDGERREETTFIDVDAFGRQAETISRYMSKGQGILIEGRLRLDQWESNTGEKRSKMVVVAENFQFVGGRGDGEGGGGGGSRGDDYERSAPPRRENRPAPARREEAADDLADDDVPF